MLITLLNSCFTPSKFWSHHQFSRSYRHNFDHTMKMLITLLKSCFTSSKFWSHHLFSRSHRHNFHHTIKGVKQVLCSVIANQMQKSWICGTKHADITPISIVGMIDTHNRWNQVFVVWPSYVSVQNKFVWVWLPQMDANMLHVRFVRPWWDSTAWTVEYSRIQFMHWYNWRDITPWHFSAVRLVGEGHRHHRSIYKECVNVLWLQSTLNSNLSTHAVCTKQVVTWCHGDFVLFCYLIIPKQRGFTPKNGVMKKKNSGNWHHLVKRCMFWYLHPLKTCKLVPISLKHVRLGAN